MAEVTTYKPLSATTLKKKTSRIPVRVHGSQSKGKPSEETRASQPSNGPSPAKPSYRPALSGRERKGGGVGGAVSASKSKENIPPVRPSSTRRPVPPKSNISYMELKKRHEELVSEVQARDVCSREADGRHHTEVEKLVGEIEGYRETNTNLRAEISSYQAEMGKRNAMLDELQKHLEEIKLENKRLTALLEGARLDAVTGKRVETSLHFQKSEHQRKLDLQAHEERLDSFISTLESTMIRLQDHKTSC